MRIAEYVQGDQVILRSSRINLLHFKLMVQAKIHLAPRLR